MEIEIEKFKNLLNYMVDHFAALEEELLSYKALVLAVQISAGFDPPLAEQLERARPGARLAIEKKYEPLRELLRGLSEHLDLQEFLRQWKPTGSIN